MNNYRYMNKIVIEAIKEWPKPPIMSHNMEGEFDYYHSDYFIEPASFQSYAKDSLNICDIYLRQWKVTMHCEYIERFRKVAAIVGEEKAADVLKALGM